MPGRDEKTLLGSRWASPGSDRIEGRLDGVSPRLTRSPRALTYGRSNKQEAGGGHRIFAPMTLAHFHFLR